jgi:hypothetical protein
MIGLAVFVVSACPATAARPLDDRPLTEAPRVLEPAIQVAEASGGFLPGLFGLFSSKPKPAPQSIPGVILRTPMKSGGGALGSSVGSRTLNLSPIPQPRRSPTYRTVCVRLCDGYYWPISSGTVPASIARDKNTCESSCGSETRLFIQHDLGADAGAMRDLSGQSYKKLANAFVYRKKYLPQCQCRPEPWSAAEIARHQAYAAAELGLERDETSLELVAASEGDEESDDARSEVASGQALEVASLKPTISPDAPAEKEALPAPVRIPAAPAPAVRLPRTVTTVRVLAPAPVKPVKSLSEQYIKRR